MVTDAARPDSPDSADRGNPGDGTEYAERLTLPWWWWPIGAGLAAVLAVEVHLAARGLPLWAAYLTAALPVLLGFGALGRTPVRVTGGELRVADARLPVRYVGEVVPLDAAGKARLLGPEGDPAAFVVHRGWVPGAVYLRLDDATDPTPYWLVSSRRPATLAAALDAAAGR